MEYNVVVSICNVIGLGINSVAPIEKNYSLFDYWSRVVVIIIANL